MNTTLAYLRSRRAWLVTNLAVWGADRDADISLAIVEQIASDKRLGLWRISLGGQNQQIKFSDLLDYRGNSLPTSIVRPVIVIIPKSSLGAFIKSVDGDSCFSIARKDSDSAPALVDLLIFEMGK
ncbi:MAG: hypothetical protein KAR42_05375 [candidate division Zixibacteria bacterium]|nr:hypothetical protein [candidate division Zixibacteria bacterium]